MANPDYDALLSTTLDNHRNTLTDNLSKNVAIWHFLKEHGSVKTRGGNKVVVPLMYAHNSTVESYSGYDPLDDTPQDEFTAAEFAWKQAAAMVYISGIEEAKNSGPEAVIDLLESKIEVAEISLIDYFERVFMGDGTGNSGKDMNGLALLIGDASSTITEVGGIDCADPGNEYWESYVDRTAGPLTIERMTHAFHMASRGREMPRFGLDSLKQFEAYNALLQPAQRFTDSKTAEAGFRNLTFQGQPLVWSDYAEDDEAYFLNPKFVHLYKLGDNWMRSTPFEGRATADSRSSKILSYGQLGISNRKLGGSKLEGLT